MKNLLIIFSIALFGACTKKQTTTINTSGIIKTFAGNGYSGDGSPATSAKLNSPYGVAVDDSGNVYITDNSQNCIRKVSTSGIITTIATGINLPYSLAVDKSGNVYIGEENHLVLKLNKSGIISTYAGGGTSLGDGGQATAAFIGDVSGIAVDEGGNLYIAEWSHPGGMRKVDTSGIITTIPFGGINSAYGVTVDKIGNLYIAGEAAIIKMNTSGTTSVIAGIYGYAGFSGDGGQADSAKLGSPLGVAVDASGNVYFADISDNVVRKVDVSGIITTVVGKGEFQGKGGYSGDSGQATSAELCKPTNIAFDASGNLYIADWGNSVIRKVSK